MINDIRALVMDFDGVLTDNKVIVSEDGKESVMCSRDDGYALERIKELGISTLILSREKNKVVLEDKPFKHGNLLQITYCNTNSMHYISLHHHKPLRHKYHIWNHINPSTVLRPSFIATIFITKHN